MAKATWKIVAKNSDTDYVLNPKTGKYESKTIDYVEGFESFEAALAGFLSWVNDLKHDEYDEFGDKVSLVYTPASSKKSK